ncbi:MAG: extracellular solute-binding protein, partial [Clostridiales bacterium]|nr:extracellular solute-binding protein [Clostridiales bacterium]
MKKTVSILLAFVLLVSLGSLALAEETVDVHLFQLKVEIKSELEKFAQEYTDAHPGVNVTVETLGGGADYHGALKAKLQGGQMPTLFVIEGQGGYEVWKENMADMAGAKWTEDTDLAFIGTDGATVGFPVAIEGYGLGYNV